MKKFFSNYFYYTKTERNAALILLLICFCGLIAPRFYPYFLDQPEITINVKKNGEAQLVNMSTQPKEPDTEELSRNNQQQQEKFVTPVKSTIKIQRVPFDPNTANHSLLIQLGFSDKLAQTLINYRNKGGRFYQKEDLKKIYGLSTSLYNSLVPYIQIESKQPNKMLAPKELIIDINQSDTTAWQQLYGIGPTFSRRIVKFRDKLGGFYSIDQVAETYGLPDSTFQSIRPQLRLSPLLQKIKINQISEEALKTHPYISWKQARTIIMYRNNHGTFAAIEGIKACMAFKQAELEKLAPYLSFE
jgi:DNA uptake protein ComE-like DNA-binding protein